MPKVVLIVVEAIFQKCCHVTSQGVIQPVEKRTSFKWYV